MSPQKPQSSFGKITYMTNPWCYCVEYL